MANDDKGLLEDLIGESLEEAQDLENQPQTLRGEEQALLGDMSLESDQTVIQELGGGSRGVPKLLVVLLILLLGVGSFAAVVKLKIINLPMPSFIYDSKKKIDITQVTDKSGKRIVKTVPNRQAIQTAATTQENPVIPPPQTQNQSESVSVVPPAVSSSNQHPAQQVEPPKAAPPAAVVAPVTEAPKQAPVISELPKTALPKPVKAPPVQSAQPVQKVEPPPQVEHTVPPQAQPVAAAEGSYTIRVGSYLFKSSLAEPLKKVKSLGFKPQISKVSRNVSMHQVLVGNFQNHQVAEAAIKDLQEEKIKAKLIKNPKGGLSALAGAYYYVAEANRLKKKLEEFGYEARVEKSNMPQELQELRVGSYVTREAAQDDIARLKTSGLQAVITEQ